jgi:LemA protein
MTMATAQWITLGVMAAGVFWSVGAYNRLVRLRNEIGNAYAQIDVQLKRRHDLIPNLVEVARKYMAHEAQTLEVVTAARNQATAALSLARGKSTVAGPIKSLGMAEGVLDHAMERLMAVMENYPELKADQTLRELSEELTSTENKVAFARQLFNDQVLAFNNAVQEFPTNLLSGLFSFTPAAMLESTRSPAEREPAKVQF